jgi:hypothetical protein
MPLIVGIQEIPGRSDHQSVYGSGQCRDVAAPDHGLDMVAVSAQFINKELVVRGKWRFRWQEIRLAWRRKIIAQFLRLAGDQSETASRR